MRNSITSLKMPKYRVNCNQLYFNQTLGTYEKGLLLGDSQYQFGDELEATTQQAKDAVASGDLVAL